MKDMGGRNVEAFRSGYPRYTALLSAHLPWLSCRRFNRLRARLLLLKQDKLSLLEQQLDRIDQEESAPLFLGQSRSDGNLERVSTLTKIEIAMADYDQFVERTQRMLCLQGAERRDIESLQHWVEGTGCLARAETEYLSHQGELVSLVATTDSAILRLEAWVEAKLIRHWQGSSRFRGLSADPNVYIYRGPWIKRIARTLLIAITIVVLMLPVVICNFISALSARIVVVIVSTSSYLIILSWLTKSRALELIVAGATYATVLIVFVSSTNTGQT